VQLLDRGPRAQRIAAGAAIAVAVMGFVALVAYLSGLRALFGIAQQSQMAVPSAVSCLILGLGLLHSRPEREPVLIFASQTSGGALARRLVPIVILVPVALAVMRHRGQAVGLYPEAVGDWLYVLAVIGLILPMVYSFVRSLDTLEHERRSAAQMLESRELEYKALAENAVEAIISTDERGLIVYANRSTERIFGWPPEELLGERLTLLMPERLGEAQFAELTELATALVAGTSPPMVELTGLTKSGIEFPYELSLSHFSDGESVLFTGVMRDISTAKRAAQRSAARYGGARALAEASRVLRPKGRLLVMEHVRAQAPGLARWQDRFTPLWKTLNGGCHLNRPTRATIEAAGFAFTSVQEFRETRIPLAFIQPMLIGVGQARQEGGEA